MQIKMFNKLFSLNNKLMKINFKNSRKGSPFVIFITTTKGKHTISFYPLIFRWVKTNLFTDLHLAAPTLSYSYIDNDKTTEYLNAICVSKAQLDYLCNNPF